MAKHSNTGLRIIIVGCSKVGGKIAAQLAGEGHDVTVIDKNPETIAALTGLYDVMGVVGNGASYSVQMEAGIQDTDLLIAVTGSDELNLLCCTVAKRVAGCSAIARVRTPEYSEEAVYLREQLGLALIINPELEAAREAARILHMPTALEINSFAHGQAEMVQFKIPEGNALIGTPLYQMHKVTDVNVLVCAVERDDDFYIPTGGFVFEEGDTISVVASRKNTKRFLQNIGFNTRQVKDTLIVGGGRAAFYLAKQLLAAGINVKIIEINKKRCEELSILLPKATIICGDGCNEDLLKEEGIAYAGSFVPLTGIDEENIMLTLFAKSVSNAKIITKINRIGFRDVIRDLDLGSLIDPRPITSEAILTYVRAMNNASDSDVVTLYHLFDGRAEAVEFQVSEKSAVTDVMLSELSLRDNLLIAFINHGGRICIPKGQDCIRVGDTVMIVTTHTGLRDISDILK